MAVDDDLSELLNSVAATANDAVLITEGEPLDEADGGPRIVYVNEAFERMTGYTQAEVLGRTPRLLQCAETDQGELRRIRRALDAWEGVESELLNRRKDGRPFWVQISIAPASANGAGTHWVSIQRDVTERRERQQRDEDRLRAARERLRGAFGNAPIGMAVAAPDGTLLEVNDSLAHLLGHPPGALIGTTLFELTHADDRLTAEEACAALGDVADSSVIDCRFVTAEGRELHTVVHAALVRDADGAADHVVLHVEDLTERTAFERELSRRALTDPLTGLPNRAMLVDRLAQALGRHQRDGKGVALLFVDIDGFKAINDEYGHAAGDRVISMVAEQLPAVVRPGDTVARFGGDEFVVLCEQATEHEAEVIAARLRRALAGAAPDGSVQAVRLSIGLSTLQDGDGFEPEVLLAHADTAMYEAKRRGGDRTVAFNDEMRALAAQRRTLVSELRTGIEHGELRLHYQPVVRLADRTLVGTEALVRWQHPRRDLLLPGDFIPSAESAGLIEALGSWVTAAACAHAAVYRHVPTVWINVSAGQLSPAYVEEITAALAAHDLDPARVGLELTETVLLEDLHTARDQLAGLRALGLRIAIDDFGTGYSSLAYLAELPVTTVKIDRSFTARLGRGERGRLVVSAVLGMASALGLDAIAEGVETEDQARALQELGVEYAQGFHLGRPRP